MADVWSIDKKLDALKEEVRNLKEESHPPIFTRELVIEIMDRLDGLEKTVCTCKSKIPKKKKPTKSSTKASA